MSLSINTNVNVNVNYSALNNQKNPSHLSHS